MNKGQVAKWLAASGLSVAAALSGGYLIKPWEGEVKNKQGLHVAYLDAVGVPTICYGQTGKDLYGRTIKLGLTLKEEECMEMLANNLRKWEKDVNALVKVPYKSPYQEAALISFAYNVGIGNLKSSTLLRKLNAGEHEDACGRLVDWVYAQKKKLQGLVNRRNEEMQWCLGNVPMDVKVNYTEIVDMVRETTDKR